MNFVESIITNPSKISSDEIVRIIDRGLRPTIQFDRPVHTEEILQQVNELCREFRDQLVVRFYGHYGDVFDASILSCLPEVRCLAVDCLRSIVNETAIGFLPNLSRLSLGIYELNDPAFLSKIPVRQLTHLSLGENSKRNLDLAPLSAANQLEDLWIEGHDTHIEVLAELPKVQSLTLRCLSKSSKLAFLNSLRSLRNLTLILGGRTSIDELSHEQLEELSVLRVRGIESLGDLNRFPRLSTLVIEDQAQIHSVDVTGLPLRILRLVNCKNLLEVEGLDSLDELLEFRTSQTRLDLEMLLHRKWPASTQVVSLASSSLKWNDMASATLAARGIKDYDRNLHNTIWR